MLMKIMGMIFKSKKITSVLDDRDIEKGQLVKDTLLTVETKYINEKEANSEKFFTVMYQNK